MRLTVIYCILISLLIFDINSNDILKTDETVSVDTNNGPIIGRKYLIDGTEIDIFLGIPYAEPPIGELRFKKPIPVKQWKRAFDAKKWPNPCYHVMTKGWSRDSNRSEDCLYLNIWCPIDLKEELKPVMVWIHGGILTLGSSSDTLYNMDILAKRGDLVVVSFNYRLNIFGFLYTGTDDAPGNMGLWDQALALKWVNNNIKYFGGDPKRITIFGQSAGGWSASLHILSPITRNLFQNVILISGSALMSVTGNKPEKVKKSWLKGVKAIGCKDHKNNSEIDFTHQIIECLRKSDPNLLIGITSLPQLYVPLIGFPPLVIIDGKFLPKKPIDMLRARDHKRNFNLLIGTAKDEGSFFLNMLFPKDYGNSPQNITYIEAYNKLKMKSSSIASEIPIDGNEISKIYFKNLTNCNDHKLLRRTIGIAIGDFYLTCPTLHFAEFLYNNNRTGIRVFQYFFNRKVHDFDTCLQWMGSCHSSDLWPLFGFHLRKTKSFNSREKAVSIRMIDMFANFAKNGFVSHQDF